MHRRVRPGSERGVRVPVVPQACGKIAGRRFVVTGPTKSFAAHPELQWTPGASESWQATGHAAGFEATIDLKTGVTRITVRVPTICPTLRVARSRDDRERTHTGDADFDAEWVVTGDPVAVAAHVTAPVRQALRAAPYDDDTRLLNGALVTTLLAAEPAECANALGRTVTLAAHLDGAPLPRLVANVKGQSSADQRTSLRALCAAHADAPSAHHAAKSLADYPAPEVRTLSRTLLDQLDATDEQELFRWLKEGPPVVHPVAATALAQIGTRALIPAVSDHYDALPDHSTAARTTLRLLDTLEARHANAPEGAVSLTGGASGQVSLIDTDGRLSHSTTQEDP